MNNRNDEPIGKCKTGGRGIVIVGCDKDKTNNVGMLSAASLYFGLSPNSFSLAVKETQEDLKTSLMSSFTPSQG